MKFVPRWRGKRGNAAFRRVAASNLYMIDGRYRTLDDLASEIGVNTCRVQKRRKRLVDRGEPITLHNLRMGPTK